MRLKQNHGTMYLTIVDWDQELDTIVVETDAAVAEQRERERIIARHMAAVAEHQRTLAELERFIKGCSR